METFISTRTLALVLLALVITVTQPSRLPRRGRESRQVTPRSHLESMLVPWIAMSGQSPDTARVAGSLIPLTVKGVEKFELSRTTPVCIAFSGSLSLMLRRSQLQRGDRQLKCG